MAPAFPSKPYGYSYNVKEIYLSIRCALHGSTGFRCMTGMLGIIKDVMYLPSLPNPAFSTVRDWLLKLGLFNLLEPQEAGEWVWIIDCSIQIGSKKCLLILGTRLEILRKKKNFVLSHTDVETLVLKIVDSCRAEIVKEALDEAKRKTGDAVAIISDEAAELKCGCRLFQKEQNENQKSIHLHDITHKLDLVLKKELEQNPEWKKFTQELTNTIQQLKLSPSSYLIPPKQRQKNRMRSEVSLIEWGIKILQYMESEKATKLEKEKLSWVFNYRSQLGAYQEMGALFDMSVKEVREHGYCRETVKILKEMEELMLCSEQSRTFFWKILKAIEAETSKVPENVCLPGCSEVIESVFGKFKQLEKNHASGGLTSLVLSLPTFVGNMSEEIIKTAMETISIDQVKGWIKDNLGSTFWSQRRNNLGINKSSHSNKNYLDLDGFLEVAAS